ncbi:TIGR02099 family protein [Aestuariirhabdus sp. Z084]|uniref:YhdP family protein n=1 Tax=Aestuariirhabdus haliotis TaxID=2918751 RepID=UPI00201B3FB9|nr:YhdP family protein [Aestuariirhabdus haliotis]MCL6415217.1 TIGR02099 family protein [Aestuariirhabdus haliotis]MCL6419477.1 TIGR02099 family protein [Aestuariirhabdus haliotis]
MKKVAFHLTRGTWLLTLLLVVLLGVYLLVGRLLVPYVENYRLVAERELSEMLGARVTIESMTGHFRGFNPALEAKHVDISPLAPSQGFSSNIHIDSLSAEISFFGTLQHREISLQELVITRLEIFLNQNEQGQWNIAGWEPKATAASEEDKSIKEILANLVEEVEQQGHVQIIDSTVHVQPWQQTARKIDQIQMDLFDLPRNRIQLDLRARSGFQQPMHLMATLEGDVSDPSDLRLDAYFQAGMLQLGPWLKQLVFEQVSELNVKPELWLNWNGERWQTQGSLDIGRLQVLHEGVQHTMNDLSIDLSANYHPDNLWQLWLQNLSFSMAGYQWPNTELYLQGDTSDVVTFGIPQLDLGVTRDILLGSEILSGMPLELVKTLNPSGVLEGVQLRYLPQQEDFDISARLVDVAVDAWGDAPSGHGVNGFVHASKSKGYLDLESSNFTLGLLNLFREPWHYRQADGVLYWQIADNQYSLMTENMLLVGDEGEVHGQFRLDIPFDERPVLMGLHAGIRNGDVRHAGKYIPFGESGLDEDVISWLDAALVQGKIREGSFMMNGALQDVGAENDFTVGLFFDVEQATINYDPEWPLAEQVNALVVINDDDIRVDSKQARVWGAKVDALKVRIPTSPEGQSTRLSVVGHAKSSPESALKLLRESPINDILDGEAHDWELAGDIGVNLNLDIALGEGGSEDRYQVEVDFDNNRFQISSLQLPLENLSGRLVYDSLQGITSEPLSLNLLGSAVRMQALKPQNSSQIARFSLDGTVALTKLYDWLEQLQGKQYALDLARKLVTGKAPYTGQVLIAEEQGKVISRTTIESRLQGIKIDVPSPLGKSAEQARSLKVRIDDEVDDSDKLGFRWRYGALLDGALFSQNGSLTGGALEIGGKQANPGKQPSWLNVSGTIDQLLLEDWLDWVQKLPRGTAVQASGDSALPIKLRQLRVGQVKGYDHQFDELWINGDINGEDIVLEVESPKLSGTLSSGSDDQPYGVNLERLYLAALTSEDIEQLKIVSDAPLEEPQAVSPEEPRSAPEADQTNEDATEPDDPLKTTDPSQFPAVDLIIADLRFGEESWGSIGANIRPYEEGVHFFNINATIRQVEIEGDLSWAYSNGLHHTYTKGSLSIEDMGDVLENWGVGRYIETKQAHYDFNFNWPGSPAAVSMLSLTGSVEGELNDGRFLEAGKGDALRLFGVLNINTITRRLKLDFSDLLSSGIAFDKLTTHNTFASGVVTTEEPVTVDGPGSDFKLTGTVDLNTKQIDAELVVTLPLTGSLPILGLVLVNPVVGGGLLVFDQLLGDQVQQLASVNYRIEGDATNPTVEVSRVFGRQ